MRQLSGREHIGASGTLSPELKYRDCTSVYKCWKFLHASRKVQENPTSGTPFRLATAFRMSFRNQQIGSDLGVFRQ